MRLFTIPSLTLLAVACYAPETGIDQTTLVGTVELPPAAEALEEDTDGTESARDTYDTAQEIELNWRWQNVGGQIRQFPPGLEDVDWYSFSPLADGAFTVVFEYGEEYSLMPGGSPGGAKEDTGQEDTGAAGDTDKVPNKDTGDKPTDDTGDTSGDTSDTAGDSADTGFSELEVYAVYVHDLSELDADGNPTEIAGGLTDGSAGIFEIPLDEVTAGGSYAVSVAMVLNDNGSYGKYEVWFSSSDPTDSGIKLGAYADASDYANRGDPVSGAAVNNWVFDADSRTWSGTYEMLYFKSVTSDTGMNSYGEVVDVHEVTEGAGTVYLVGGTFSSLNQGLPAGTLHNGTPIEVVLKADKENTADTVVIDTIAPKEIGWETAEEEPNDVAIDENTYNLSGDLADAQALPVGSGVPFVDVITGTMSLTIDDPYWTDDQDVYALTVSESANATFALAMPTDVDFDLHLYDFEGTYIAVGWGEANSNPEFINTELWGVTLEPDTTYYIAVHPWEGAAGDHEYQIEIEWIAP